MTEPARIADAESAYWRRLRDEFVLDPAEAYFNAGTLAPSPRAVVDAMAAHLCESSRTLSRWEYRGEPSWIAGYEAERALRAEVGWLVGGDAAEISLTRNATVGINQVASGLDFAPGDEVVQTDQEHPGGRSVWEVLERRRGIVRRVVALPVPANDPAGIVERVRAACGPRTRVIAWPHITSALGTVQPVEALCALARERRILTLIDGAQAVGQIPVDVRAIGCDAYVASPHKWLGAPAGSGLLWVRPDLAARLWPLVATQGWDDHADEGWRLQSHGTGNLTQLVGLRAAIDFFRRVGPARWHARVRALGDRLRAGLSSIRGARIASATHPAMCAGMTTWTLSGWTGERLQDELWRRGRLRPRAVPEWGVRQSTSVHNLESEIDATIELAAELSRA